MNSLLASQKRRKYSLFQPALAFGAIVDDCLGEIIEEIFYYVNDDKIWRNFRTCSSGAGQTQLPDKRNKIVVKIVLIIVR